MIGSPYAKNAAIAEIGDISGSDGDFIVHTGAAWVAESGATARTSLGLSIGSDVQAFGAVLDDLSSLGAPASDGQVIVATGAGVFAYESGATARASLGLVIGTDVQAQGAVLDDLNTLGANSADNEVLIGTGAGVLAWESGATLKTSLGLTIGTNVQAYDAGLDSLAALTYASDSFIKVTAEDTYAIRTIAETKTDLSLNNVSNVATNDTAYNATSWDANNDAATKNAIRDKIETMDTAIAGAGGGDTYVDRGDPTPQDWHEGTFGTYDSTWRDKDLSAIVPAGAAGKLVRLSIGYQPSGVNHTFQLRQKGRSNNWNVFKITGIVGGVFHWHTAEVLCDANRVIQYYISAGPTQTYVTIRGWWI